MIVEFTGQTNPLALTNSKRYNVMSIECGWYRIVDSTEEDYLYSPDLFTIVEAEPAPPIIEPSPKPPEK
ncbi:MAG: hypothetical protein RSD25_02235 [Raoultibacter sp.]